MKKVSETLDELKCWIWVDIYKDSGSTGVVSELDGFTEFWGQNRLFSVSPLVVGWLVIWLLFLEVPMVLSGIDKPNDG